MGKKKDSVELDLIGSGAEQITVYGLSGCYAGEHLQGWKPSI